MKKRNKCAVNGNIVVGPHTGICTKIRMGNDSRCGAHGNTKCIHMRKPDWDEKQQKLRDQEVERPIS